MIIKIKKTDLNKLIKEVVAERTINKNIKETHVDGKNHVEKKNKVVKEENPDRGGSNNKYYLVGTNIGGSYFANLIVYASSAGAAKKAAAMIVRGGNKSLTGFVARIPENSPLSKQLTKFVTSNPPEEEEV